MARGDKDEEITTAEAAHHWGVSPVRIRQLIAEGRLKVVRKVGVNNLLRRSEVERLTFLRRRPSEVAGEK